MPSDPHRHVTHTALPTPSTDSTQASTQTRPSHRHTPAHGHIHSSPSAHAALPCQYKDTCTLCLTHNCRRSLAARQHKRKKTALPMEDLSKGFHSLGRERNPKPFLFSICMLICSIRPSHGPERMPSCLGSLYLHCLFGWAASGRTIVCCKIKFDLNSLLDLHQTSPVPLSSRRNRGGPELPSMVRTSPSPDNSASLPLGDQISLFE